MSTLGISRFKEISNHRKSQSYPQKRRSANGYPQDNCDFTKLQDVKEHLAVENIFPTIQFAIVMNGMEVRKIVKA